MHRAIEALAGWRECVPPYRGDASHLRPATASGTASALYLQRFRAPRPAQRPNGPTMARSRVEMGLLHERSQREQGEGNKWKANHQPGDNRLCICGGASAHRGG